VLAHLLIYLLVVSSPASQHSEVPESCRLNPIALLVGLIYQAINTYSILVLQDSDKISEMTYPVT